MKLNRTLTTEESALLTEFISKSQGSCSLEDDVRRMYNLYLLQHEGGPRHLSYEEKNYRVACLAEELEEYAAADDLVSQYDALLDLLVFTVGSLYRHGFPLQQGWDAVMAANMNKRIGNNPQKSNVNRAAYKGTDLVKPDGWVGPEDTLCSILVEHSAVAKMEQSPCKMDSTEEIS